MRLARARKPACRGRGEAAAEPGSAGRKRPPVRGARGWSSLAVSACSVVALVLAAPAAAHVSVDPQRVATGALVDLTFSAPNEGQPGGVHRVTLTVPSSFDLDDAEAKPTWTQTRAGRSVTWSGGTIPVGQFATFRIRGTVPPRPGPVTFDLRSGSAVYRIAVDAVASPGADQGARTLGKVALGIALGAALLAVAGLFAELYRWLRS